MSPRGEMAMVPPATPMSYYGHPVLKPPVWKPEVGVYLFSGGLAGGSAMLVAGARMIGNDVLARRALYTATVAAAISPVLLITDLGVPRRFHHMLRVAKPTSPMSVGTWVLSGVASALGMAATCETLHVLPRLQRLAEGSAALLAPALATYTAVLLADTAVPVWHDAQRELPFVFAASAAASAGAAATMLTPSRFAAPARTLAITGAVGELAATRAMRRRLGKLDEPYRGGTPGMMASAATRLAAGGMMTLALGGRRRSLATVAGAAVLAASFCTRWAVFRAGSASAQDPRYTVGPQRERLRRRAIGGT